MITLFTTAKPFVGETGKRQEAALASWKRMAPDVEIILFGEGLGYDEVAKRLGLIRHTDVLTGERGCPRIDSMFEVVERIGRHAVKGYVNADILLTEDLVHVASMLPFESFLLVAERLNVAFPETDWLLRATSKEIRAYALSHGTWAYHMAIDLFVYRGDIWRGLPPLIVGRAAYDNYLIYACRLKGVPVVDASREVSVIHQTHDYSHLSDGLNEVRVGPEAQVNLQSIGSRDKLFTIKDADWCRTSEGLFRNRCRGDARRYADTVRTLAVGRRSWVRFVPLLWTETWCQICERFVAFRRGRVVPLLKFPLWLMARLINRR